MDVVVKGTPISFPDIDPVALVKYGKIPDVRTGKIALKTSVRSKKQAEELALKWRPWRTAACWFLWRSIDPNLVVY